MDWFLKVSWKFEGDRNDAPSSRRAVRKGSTSADEPGRSGWDGRSLACNGARRMRLLGENSLGLELDDSPAIVRVLPSALTFQDIDGVGLEFRSQHPEMRVLHDGLDLRIRNTSHIRRLGKVRRRARKDKSRSSSDAAHDSELVHLRGFLSHTRLYMNIDNSQLPGHHHSALVRSTPFKCSVFVQSGP